MKSIYRTSPVQFEASAVQSQEREGWTVVLEYAEEGEGPWIIDLSHLSRWDLQDLDVGQYKPWGLNIPETPGTCLIEGSVLINRMNQTQAAIWNLGPNEYGLPEEAAYTDIQESTLCLAVLGSKSLAVSEKLTDLDLADPRRTAPSLIQGPFAHVPCQIVLLGCRPKNEGFVFTCARGYARDMVQALLQAGEEFGMRPAGERCMAEFLDLQEK